MTQGDALGQNQLVQATSITFAAKTPPNHNTYDTSLKVDSDPVRPRARTRQDDNGQPSVAP